MELAGKVRTCMGLANMGLGKSLGGPGAGSHTHCSCPGSGGGVESGSLADYNNEGREIKVRGEEFPPQIL